MSKIRAYISVSVDGYVAGPNQTMEEPLGENGERLHDWAVELKSWRELQGMAGGAENASSAVIAEDNANVGAEIMGRGKFGPPSRGAWGKDPWRGWWGEDPPFHKLLGGGARLFEGVGPDVKLKLARTIEAPGVTHLKYRVLRTGA